METCGPYIVSPGRPAECHLMRFAVGPRLPWTLREASGSADYILRRICTPRPPCERSAARRACVCGQSIYAMSELCIECAHSLQAFKLQWGYRVLTREEPEPLPREPLEPRGSMAELADGWSPGTAMGMVLTVQLGDRLFAFRSYGEWVNKAQSWFRELRKTLQVVDGDAFLLLDQAGRICSDGADFQRARDERTFPVTVYRRHRDG